jgi:hypothetical protein
MNMMHRMMALLLAGIAACSYGTESVRLDGTYVASVFRVTPQGQSQIDVLGAGGSMTLTIGSNNAVTGTLVVPGSVTGGGPLSESMAGTAARDGDEVTFTQTADTFVRDLTWSLSAEGLRVTNQTAGGASFTVTLSRQGSAY